MTKPKLYLIPDTEYPMPRPEAMPADMPEIIRQYRPPSSERDHGEALFDAVLEYFGVDLDDPEAGWKLAGELMWRFLPGSHDDPRGTGGRQRRDQSKLLDLGRLWHEVSKREAATGLNPNQAAIYKKHRSELRQNELFKTVADGRSALNLLRRAEAEYLSARDTKFLTKFYFRKALLRSIKT